MSSKDDSPHWVRALTDSVIHVAAAIALIASTLGIDFSGYFRANEEAYASIKKLEVLRMELELEKERKRLPQTADSRFKALEDDSHPPGG